MSKPLISFIDGLNGSIEGKIQLCIANIASAPSGESPSHNEHAVLGQVPAEGGNGREKV